jgi:tetratricopeptide (TPR) repeat protein
VRAKNYEEAIKNFNDALAIDAAFPLAHRELSDLYFRAGKFDKAKTEFDEFTKNAEPTIDTKIRSAKILYKNERYDDAITAMNEVLKVQPNNYIMYRLLAYSFTKKEKMTDAETYFQKYFQLVPQKELIATDYSNYAKVLNAGGKDSLAIVSYKRAMEIDNSFDFNADILISYFKQKKYSQVTTEFENIVAKNSNVKDPNIYYNAARSYYYQDKFKAADSAYALVNKLSPKYAGGWWGRVRCNLRMDSTNVNYAAKPFYDKYLEVAKLDDPKNKSNVIEAYHYLADFSFTKEGDKDKAKDYCEKILALDPDDQQAKDVLKGLAEKKK